MRAAVVSGSSRRNSQSSKVARYICEIVEASSGLAPYFLDLGICPLPLWEEDLLASPSGQQSWRPVSGRLHASDAIIIVTPEWGGMAPSCVKNFLLLCTHGEISHKPGLIVSVSASLGGAYPIAELRMSSYKNNRICYIPDHIIVRNVQNVLNEGCSSSEDDQRIRDRIEHSLRVLDAYARALTMVRSAIDTTKYAYGM